MNRQNQWGLIRSLTAKEEVFALLSTAPELNGRYLQQHFQGLGKDTADELSARLLAQPNEKCLLSGRNFILSH